ncbi:MAG: hypothetical protein AB7N91_28200 [Candidatus Tectimicrobiota bacterium]
MATPLHTQATLQINRAPVLTLWGAVVAERLGFTWEEALTLGRAVAGLNAYAKGRSLGLFTPTAPEVKAQRQTQREKEPLLVDLLQRAVPVRATPAGLRALSKEQPIDPASVQRYLHSKFGPALDDAYKAMHHLAASRSPDVLAAEAYALYERFRPAIPAGTRGWGASGPLHLAAIHQLATAARPEDSGC